jgi:hypothetical protein
MYLKGSGNLYTIFKIIDIQEKNKYSFNVISNLFKTSRRTRKIYRL